MKNSILASLFLLSSACGTTTQTSDGSTSGGGGGSSTTGQSVLGGSSTGGTSTGGSSPTTFTPTPQEPIQPATYVTEFTLSTDYTTCSYSSCSSAFSTTYTLDYQGAGTYLVSTSVDSWSVEVSTVTTNGKSYQVLDWNTESRAGTSVSGCPGTTTGRILAGLLPHQIAGAYHSTWSAQACNGNYAYSCICAYDMASTSYSKAHALQLGSLSATDAHEMIKR